MKEDEHGSPKLGPSSRTLGARPDEDIRVRRNGSVVLEMAGISVSPLPPENLQKHRRPTEYGGTGKDPVFEIDTDELPRGLVYREDPRNRDTHGYISPAYPMSLERYQQRLHETQSLWRLV
jgi:hypothetical protein